MIYSYAKRFFDITATLILVLILSPIFLLVALAIRLESRGPIFYSSKRIGKGFKKFDFYKFRSMHVNADKMLATMDVKNQYQVASIVTAEYDPTLLMGDAGWIGENQFKANQEAKEAAAFVKIPNDPRITKVGNFIRNTSLDELPQLLNVLKGDMSLVGIRPIPEYEAVELTSDAAIERFDAPAGITGLWQVTERGTSSTTTSRRKELDNDYAQNMSFSLDLKILFMTPMAAFQREKV